MTTIDKLLIQGIRSFSPQNRNIIEFYKPLTLIVGHNGAGKTTIIECLKYATTGNMPPGSKNGQAFIHDPKVAGEREVKAQIKLRFRNVNGKPIVCTRSLQLTQQANNKKVCKTLESALQTYNAAGEKVSQSFRCADLDREIPELVGVSRPILENVIFCHQEEANWPLSEGAVLKKKFDEIFAATRYTKALEAIKKHRKEQAQQIKECKLRLENLQTQKDHAHQVHRELKTKLEFQAKANEEVSALQKEIDEQEQLLIELKRKFAAINALITEIKQLKAVRQQMTNENEKTYAELKQEFEESDEELLSLAASFNEEMATRRQAETALEGKLGKLHRSKEQHDAALFSINEQMGSLRSAVERRKTLLAERDGLVLEFIEHYELQGFDKPPYSDAKMTKFLETSKKLLTAINQKTQKLKEENIASAKKFSDVLHGIQSQQSTLEAQITQKQSQLRANGSKLKQLEAEIKSKKALHSSLGAVEGQMQSEQEALEKAKQEAGLEELARQISDLAQQREQAEASMASLGELMRKLNLQAGARAKLNVKKSQQAEREEAYRSRYQSRQHDLEAVLGQAVDIDALKPALAKAIASKREAVTATRSRLEAVKMNASSLTGEEKSCKSRLAQLERQLQTKKEEIKVMIGEDDRPLPVLIKEAEKKVEDVRKDVLMIQSAELIYHNFIEIAKENQECPLCDRGIHGDALKKMIDQMQATIDNVPKSLQENKQLLTEQETLYEQLCGLLPTWQDVTRLQNTEVPQIQQRLTAIQQQMSEFTDQIKESASKLEQMQAEETKASALLSDVEAILRHYKDYTALSEQVRAEESILLQSSADTRTVEDVDKEYAALKEKSQELQEAADRARKEQQARQDNIRRLEARVFELKDKLLQSKGSYESVTLLQRNVGEIESSSKALQQEIQEAEDALAIKVTEREEVVAQANRNDAENEAKMNEVVNERQLFQERLAFIETLQKQTTGKTLEALVADEEKLAKKKQETEARKAAINEDVKKGNDTLLEIRESLATSDIFKRNIDDNIKYRKQRADLEKLNARIKQKEGEAELGSTESVEFDMDRLTTTADQKKRKLNQLIGKRDTFVSQIKEHHKELSKPIYKDIDDQFRQMLIKVKTTEMAASDLEKYYHALNKALMKYHSVKMEEINKILRELWQHTYKGQDIDTIEIRADVDTKEGGKSNYNYRVIMVKGDTELDMRGRCSAGQKVLASLVIRLALAETFCLNCGILALDEPTTNLDRYNVESFANALVSIIATRSQQRNFQLIIITHDEEFVQLLGRSEHADYYWRVSKDINGHSILERQDIRDLS